ncbi:MAG: hypothetical protein A3C47_04050 [Omnitrophica bacterium RIFCSPHIGHO2_02_FULL_51_18]|nr:MAG: hypothetical protein A3C47_04050 [Omnitrophica bacterium RIFCSPHIGHO2_02_FULL_51_18]
MKKTVSFLTLTTLFLSGYVFSAETLEGNGEVISSDPVYSRVTIKHKPIQGFVGGNETEFLVTSPGLLKGINRHDLVDFTLVDPKGDVRITKITKTGAAQPKDEAFAVGQAVQDVLVTAGQAAKAVTAPIPAVNQVVSGAVGAATDTTEPVLEDAGPEIKKSF